MVILFFVAGLAFLIIGAEALVRGGSCLAAVLGISPLVIGLTVVAFGTSSPELAVSVKSVLSSQANIAVGNVVGSNIFNVLFILGLSALIVPLTVSQQLVRLDVPLMIVLSVIVLVLSLNEKFSRIDGLMLVAGLVIYFWFLIYQSRKESAEARKKHAKERGTERHVKSSWGKNIGLVLGGLALLILGSHWLVDSAVSFAQYLGVSELVVGFDIPVMIGVALACLPIFFTGGVISRQEGVLLLGYYVAYTLYLVLAASHHDALPRFSTVMLYFVIPLTAITMMMFALREMRNRKKQIKF